ncbi:hypothetical protein LCGC14_1799450 [marine sediment metagenome]|uniref:Stc1 domain-containing protein n=1 Tax=marine sediment metagenome TaxID=412755 RepID=A0A0F9J4V0_9ZZZZ
MKTCAKCKEEKLLTDFSLRGKAWRVNPNSRRSRCKECRNRQDRERLEEHRLAGIRCLEENPVE